MSDAVHNALVPVLGFAAYSGTGKTTLLLKVLPQLTQKGLRVGVVKHAHHTFDIDQPGTDSYELRKSGAVKTIIGSRKRRALITETDLVREPKLGELLADLDQDDLDLVLVEGFKYERFPKIELHRPSLGLPPLFPEDDAIVAVAADAPFEHETHLPTLDLNRPADIAEFVLKYVSNEVSS